MKHDAIRADGARMDAQALAAQHIAALETVPLLTDMSTIRCEAKQLMAKVSWYASNGDRGMLGRNGLGPQIEMCVSTAARTGFDWRERHGLAVDPRAFTDLVYHTAGGR